MHMLISVAEAMRAAAMRWPPIRLASPGGTRVPVLAAGRLALAMALALVACVGRAAAQEPSGEGPEPRIRAVWGERGEVGVRAERDQPSGSAAWSFVLRWSPHGEDGSLRFELAAPAVHSLDGRPVRGGEMQAQAAALAALDLITPAWIVGPDGGYVGLDPADTARVVLSVLDQLEDGSALDEDERAALGDLLTSPGFRRLARSRPPQLWALWWGHWQEIPMREGAAVEREQPLRSEVADFLSYVVLQVRRVERGGLRPRAEVSRSEEFELRGEGSEAIRRLALAEAVLDPATRRPLMVTEQDVQTLGDPRRPLQEALQRAIYAFDWLDLR